jgi:hypothetical protein
VIALRDSPTICTDCVALHQLALLGDDGGNEGHIAPAPNIVVRDSVGRYWVSQNNNVIKVFDSAGKFVHSVGRRGRGPGEFGAPFPAYTDSAGNVHVLDLEREIEFVIGPDFRHISQRAAPAGGDLASAVRFHGRDAWVINDPMAFGPERGAPIRISRESKVLVSFGKPHTVQSPNPILGTRRLGVDSRDRIFSAKAYHFELEAWTDSGARIASFSGPMLNEREVRLAPFNLGENPIPAQVLAIQPGDSSRLWVLTRRPRENWRDYYEARSHAGVQVIQVRNGMPEDSVFRSRLEVIDLRSRSIIARQELPGVFSSFVGDGLLMQSVTTSDGASRIAMWQFRLDGKSSR